MQKSNTAATVNKVDEYPQALPADIGKTPEQLRQIIRAAAPALRAAAEAKKKSRKK